MDSIRSSAAYRIAFTYAAAFAAIILLLGVAVYFAADAEFRQLRDKAIAEELAELQQETRGRDILAALVQREGWHAPGAFLYGLFDRNGRRLAGTIEGPPPSPGFGSVNFEDPEEGTDIARARAVDLPDGRRLVVGQDSETIEAVDATILTSFATAFLVIAIASVAGALVLGRYLSRRLAAIRATATAIIAGNSGHRIAVSPRGDEFDAVALALNTMLDRIAGLMENLRQVSSDVAHDLRTPLLRLRNQLEQVGTVDGAAERAIEQGEELLRLFAAILRIAEVEGGGLEHGFRPVDLSAVVEDVGDSFLPAISDSGRMLAWQVEPDLRVLGDRELLAQAIANLLDNALVHTPCGTRILLGLASRGDHVQLSVEDDGPGVPPGEQDRIVRRFYRAEASRTTRGNGLGLNLVAAVAGAHGGAIVVANCTPGLRVTLDLPKMR